MIAFFAAVRAIHFASLMAIFGAGAFLALLRSRLHIEVSAIAARILFATAATLALITAVAWLGLVAGQMSGDWHYALDPAALTAVVTGTRFGQVFLWRVGGLAVLWIACILKTPSQNLLPALLAAALLGALGLTSHAAASSGEFGIVRAGNDAVHLLAGGFWLGGLLVLAMLMWRHREAPAALLGPLQLFSAWGTYAIAALVVTGVTNAASILPVAAVSVRSFYARVLLSKVAIASVMIALAAVNRWRLVPALRSGEPGAPHDLARSIGAEIALGATVIAIAAWLGLMPPR
jgi:putative copper resistance protein D